MENNLGLFLSRRAFLSPQREAYVDSHSELRLTFRELNERANQVANGFLAAGIKKGETHRHFQQAGDSDQFDQYQHDGKQAHA